MNVSVPLAFTQCCPGDDFTGMPSEVVHVYWSRRHSKIEHFIAFVEGLGSFMGEPFFSPDPFMANTRHSALVRSLRLFPGSEPEPDAGTQALAQTLILTWQPSKRISSL